MRGRFTLLLSYVAISLCAPDTDQFSCEYLVCVLCYCSQTDVLFPHWVGALAHTRDAKNAPPIAGVKPEKCCNLDIFRGTLMLRAGCWLTQTHAVAMVSAKCCLSYGECAKMCFPGVLKPQNVKHFIKYLPKSKPWLCQGRSLLLFNYMVSL